MTDRADILNLIKTAAQPQPTEWAKERARQIMDDVLMRPADLALMQITDRLLVTHTEGFIAGMNRSQEIMDLAFRRTA